MHSADDVDSSPTNALQVRATAEPSRPPTPGIFASMNLEELQAEVLKRGMNAEGKQLIIIGRLRHAIANEGTFIGDDPAAVQMTFEPFNRMPPPSIPQPAIHEVDLEPELDNFA